MLIDLRCRGKGKEGEATQRVLPCDTGAGEECGESLRDSRNTLKKNFITLINASYVWRKVARNMKSSTFQKESELHGSLSWSHADSPLEIEVLPHL